MSNNGIKNNTTEEKKVDLRPALREINDKYIPKIITDLQVLEELRGRRH